MTSTSQLYDFVPVGYLILDEFAVILEANLAAAGLLGAERGLLIGKPLAGFVDEEVGNSLRLHFRQALETESTQTCDIRLAIEEGNQVSLRLESSVIRNEDGSPERFRTAVIDIGRTREAELKESEERFRLLYENAPLGYQSLDENGCFLEINRAWSDLLGYSREEVIGKWCGHFFTPPYREKFTIYFPQFKAAGKIHGIEFEMVKKDGSLITVAADGRIAHDEHGRFRQTHCILHDITEHKRAEEARALSEKIYRQMFEGSRAVKLLIDPESGELIDANPAATDFYGYPTRDLKQMKISDINVLPPEQIFAEMTKAKTEQRLHFFFKHRLASGDMRDVEVHSSPLDLGNQRILYSIIHDITERKQAEEAVDQANKNWELTFDSISDMVMVLDNQHRILRANKAMADALGMTELELIGKFCFEVVHGRKEPIAFCPHSELLTDGEQHSAEVVEPRLGGTYDVRVSPLVDDTGLVVGCVHAARDITKRKNAEESLRKSEQRLELALQGADLGLWDWYVETGEATANQRGAEIAGYSLDEIEQSFSFWESLVHPDDHPRALEKIVNHMRGLSDNFEDEYRVKHRSGDWKWVLARGKITERDLEGKPLRVTGTFLDITDKKLAEVQASEANELREKIVSESPMGIAVFRADGQCISANEALGKTIGADKQGILTQNFRNLASWKESGLLADAEQVLSGGVNNQREVHLTSTFGKSVWVNARMARLTAGGEPHLLILLNDITERRTAENELKFEREQLLSLFESINEVILVIDPQTYEILYANKFTEDMYGKRLIGGVCYERLNGFDAPCERCHNENILKLQGQPYRWEYRNPVLKKDFLATDRMIRWPDGRDVKFQIAVDISERNRAEEEREHLKAQLLQAQKMEAIATLAGGIAHDFNNLLQVVLGYSDMMLFDKKSKDPDYNRLETIRRAALDGSELAKGLLAFSRRLEPNTRPVNLNHEIDRVRTYWKERFPRWSGSKPLAADNLKTTNVDPVQIQQVLMNLAVNAVHAMPDGGRLTIETANVTLDEDYCRTIWRFSLGNTCCSRYRIPATGWTRK